MDSDYGIERHLSDLQKLRSTYLPPLPPSLQGTSVRVECGEATTAADPSDAQTIGQLFPHTYGQPLVRFLKESAESPSSSAPMRVGVVFCGRQSPGGHNVIWGIHNALKTHNPNSVLLGFLDGSEGLFAQRTLEITDDILSSYKNQGGYDLLGRTKDQIRTIEQVNASMAACTSLNLDGLVIIGGVTSNTDAAQLAEKFAEAKCPTKVVGVPVTLNGDLKNQFVETNVGFDTICKVNSQLISNVCTDALSAEKYYYFIRLMGRKASHVALECTLQSHPNMVILGEEVSASKLTLSDLTKQICDAVQARAEKDKFHGVILLPEGLIESIPEVYALLQEIHGLLEQGVSVDMISSQLSPSVSAMFEFLPPFLRKQLLLLPESDDSAQLSQIETEKLLAHLVDIEMNKRSNEGTYKGKKFNAICHFFGYQARGSLPSKFDCDYAFVLGHVCYHILAAGLTGYLATLSNLKNPVDEWHCGAAPITAMMTVKHFGRGLGDASPGKPALHPAIVDLKSKSYELLRQNAMKFLMDDVYRNLGPLQFDGPGADSKPATLCIEDQNGMDRVEEDEVVVDQVKFETPPPSALEVDTQNTTFAVAAAAESGDVSQSHDQEEAINSEPMTVLETRAEDKVPEADEYVLINSKDCFPTSKSEEEALVTKDPSDCQTQNAAVQNDSDENDNSFCSTGDFTKPESNGGDLLCPVNRAAEAEVEEEASLIKYPCDCGIEDAVVQNGSSEIDSNLHSPGNFMEPETEGGDVLRLVRNAGEAEEEASVTGYPCDFRIQDAALQNSFESDNNLHSPGDSIEPETEGGDLLHPVYNAAEAEEKEDAPVTKFPCDCRIQDAELHNSFENDLNLHSPGNSIKPETEGGDLLHPVYDAAEAEEKEDASVTKFPCDCRIQDAEIQNSFENDLNLHSPGNSIKPETEGGDLLHPVSNAAEEKEEASVTKFPCDCRILDAALQNSFENDNSLHSPGDFIKPDTEGGDILHPVTNPVEAEKKEEASVTKYPCDCRIQNAVVQNDSFENDHKLHSLAVTNVAEAEEEKEAPVTIYPCDCRIQDAAVQKDSFENDNDLYSPGVFPTPETVGIKLSYPVNNSAEAEEEEKAVVTMDRSDCHIQDASVQRDSYENHNNLHSPGNLMTSETNGDEHLCPVSNTAEAEEDEEGSVTKNPSDYLIQDADVRIHSSENGNNLHSPDDSMKLETEGGDLLCSVNNGVKVEVEGTKASNEVNEISQAKTISGSSCTDANTEASHPLAAGVLIPVMSCHTNGGLVHGIARSSVADMVSVSEIHNSSTNGMNISCTDAAVISQVPVQFGSFVPATYQGNGVCRDDLGKINCQEVKDCEQVRKSDDSKLPPSPKGHHEVEQAVAVESVERPFNFLIRIPKYYNDELNEQVRQAELQVDEKTQKREDIKFKIQVIRGNLQQARSDYTARLSEERAARRLVRLKRQEIDSVQSIINRVKNAISVEDIDSRIKHMEHMMQHETLPLKEEKQFIREIKQLKLYREQLSSNMGSQDEVRQAIDQRDQIEEQFKILKKDLDRLKHTVSTAEATTVAADTKLKEEKKIIEELYAQHGTAQNARQEAYMNLQNLRRQFYEKNARFRTYKDDTTAANDYALSGDKGALHRLCLNQVEKMMELWNKDDEFRKEYIRCNTRSTLWRLRTMDGRALGPDEELPVVNSFVEERIKSSRYRVGQVNPESTLVSADLDKMEEPLPTTEAADIREVNSVEKVVEHINKAEKAKKSGNPAMKNNSLPMNSMVETVETLEEGSNKKQTKEEQEVARKEEQLKKAEEEAKLKEQRRLEEIAKAKEALERKRKIAEKAQIRAEVRAQKEAEQKDKEKEKRAKKKERKKAGVGGDEGGDIIVPASDLIAMATVKESETKEVHSPAAGVATASKRHQKAFIKQQNKIKSASSMPAPLRNKHKRRMQQWIWIAVTAVVVLAVVLLGNMGFYPNHLGRNRHPGF